MGSASFHFFINHFVCECVCVCEVFPQVFCTFLFGSPYFFLLIYRSSLSSSYCNSLSVIYMVQICFRNLWFMFIFAMISYNKGKFLALMCLYCFPLWFAFFNLRNSSLSFSQKDILPHDTLKFFIVSHYTFKSLKHLKLIVQSLSFFLLLCNCLQDRLLQSSHFLPYYTAHFSYAEACVWALCSALSVHQCILVSMPHSFSCCDLKTSIFIEVFIET